MHCRIRYRESVLGHYRYLSPCRVHLETPVVVFPFCCNPVSTVVRGAQHVRSSQPPVYGSTDPLDEGCSKGAGMPPRSRGISMKRGFVRAAISRARALRSLIAITKGPGPIRQSGPAPLNYPQRRGPGLTNRLMAASWLETKTSARGRVFHVIGTEARDSIGEVFSPQRGAPE